MKLSDIRSVANDQLDRGEEARDNLALRHQELNVAEERTQERYDEMAVAMEVDEDFRPKGDILMANEAFELAKEELQSAMESVEEAESGLDKINREKRETIELLEDYAEERQEDRERLQGASGNRFAQSLKSLDEKNADHIEEAQNLRDQLLTSMEEGTGGRQTGGSFMAGRAEGISGHFEYGNLPETGGETTETSDSISREVSEDERRYREQIQKQRSEAFRQKVMSDPMTKNPLFSGVRSPAGAGANCLTFGINDERLGKLSYAQGNNTLNWEEDCSLAQIANILTLSGRPTKEQEVVEYVNSIASQLKSKPASSQDARLNGGMVPSDISLVLKHFGLDNDVHENSTGVASRIVQMLGKPAPVDFDQIAESVEEGKGVIMGVNSNMLNGRYSSPISANHAISIVGTARDLRTHEVMGFYINDTGCPDSLTDGRLERSQTKFVPLWRMDQAYNVPNSAAIITRNKIR